MLKSAYNKEYITGKGLSSESDESGYQEAVVESDFVPEEEDNLVLSNETISLLRPNKRMKQTKKRKQQSST